MGRHIAVVRRFGAKTRIAAPRIETYGESIGELTNEIFGLSADATGYHQALAQLGDADLPLEAIQVFFEHGPSLQARAFVITMLARPSAAMRVLAPYAQDALDTEIETALPSSPRQAP